jgi:hypothetical protein
VFHIWQEGKSTSPSEKLKNHTSIKDQRSLKEGFYSAVFFFGSRMFFKYAGTWGKIEVCRSVVTELHSRSKSGAHDGKV